MRDHKKTIKTLNNLLEKNYDAEKGFNKVAEETEDYYLKNLFRKKAWLHNKMGHELRREIHQLGGEVERSGSVAGAAHRAWIDVKTLFSLDDKDALLEECITGQRICAKEYQDALIDVTELNGTRQLLYDHCEQVNESLETLRREEEVGDY